jgi:hypothetical protein
VVALFGSGAAYVIRSTPHPPVSASQLAREQAPQPVTTAETPEGHRQWAEFYSQEAERKRKQEQYYGDVANAYRRHPPRVDVARNVSTADYYQRLAEDAHNAALADDQLAIFQDKLAAGIGAAK